jgi:hypothetical protein
MERYVAGAEGTVASRGDDDPAAQAAVEARAALSLVAEGGGAHNLTLAHRLFEESLTSAQEAYRLAGGTVPAPPPLGRAPRQGICTYCHYEMGQLGFTEEMDDEFHRAVLRGG